MSLEHPVNQKAINKSAVVLLRWYMSMIGLH